MKTKSPFLPIFRAASLLLTISYAHAVGGSWADNTGNYNWSDATRWSTNPTVPGTAAGDVINFTNDITAVRTITVNTTSRTMGTLNIGDSNNTNRFIIASSGGGMLIFDNSGAGATINETGTSAGGSGTPNDAQDAITAGIRLDDNLTVSTTGQLTLNAISQTGTRSITKTGAGTLVLNGAGTYSGGFNLNAGTVMVNTGSISAGVTSAFGTGKLTIAGGTTINAIADFQINNAVDVSGTVNWGRGVTGNKNVTQGSAGAVALTGNTTFNSLNASFTYIGNGVIGESGGARSLSTSGNTLILTLNAANTYSGGTTINSTSGVININNGGSGGTSSAIGTGALTISSAATINNTSAGLVTLSTNNAVNLNNNITFTGTQSLNLGTGAVSLNATRTVIVTANTLTLGGNIAAGAVGIVKQGAGTLALGGVNNTNGNNTLTAGVLRLDNASAAGTGNMLMNGGILGLGAANFTRSLGTGANQVAFTATTNTGFAAFGADRTVNIGNAGGTMQFGAANFLSSGELTLSHATADATLIWANPLNLANGSRTINVNNGSATVDARLTGSIGVSGGANGNFTKSGAGVLQSTANNLYVGTTTISGGTLELGNNGTTGSLSGTSSITVTGATLSVNRSNSFTQATDLNGQVISGSGGFTQAGSGTTTLSLTNTYTGATNVNAGTLIVNGNISTSSLTTVAVGATLQGTGTAGKTVINGTLDVGSSPGQMNFTDTLNLNGNAIMEIDGTAGAGVASGHDFVNLTGTLASGVLTNGGALTLDVGTIFGVGSYTWDLFDMASETGTFTTVTLADQYSGSLMDVDLNGIWDLTSGSNIWEFNESSGVLGLTVIPEPSVAALLSGLGVFALRRRRR